MNSKFIKPNVQGQAPESGAAVETNLNKQTMKENKNTQRDSGCSAPSCSPSDSLEGIVADLAKRFETSRNVMVNFVISRLNDKLSIYQQDYLNDLEQNHKAHRILLALRGVVVNRQQFEKMRLVPLSNLR